MLFGSKGLFTYYVSQIQGFLDPPPPSASDGKHLDYPPFPRGAPSFRQLSSAFA